MGAALLEIELLGSTPPTAEQMEPSTSRLVDGLGQLDRATLQLAGEACTSRASERPMSPATDPSEAYADLAQEANSAWVQEIASASLGSRLKAEAFLEIQAAAHARLTNIAASHAVAGLTELIAASEVLGGLLRSAAAAPTDEDATDTMRLVALGAIPEVQEAAATVRRTLGLKALQPQDVY
jgi:hypothetical protein